MKARLNLHCTACKSFEMSRVDVINAYTQLDSQISHIKINGSEDLLPTESYLCQRCGKVDVYINIDLLREKLKEEKK